MGLFWAGRGDLDLGQQQGQGAEKHYDGKEGMSKPIGKVTGWYGGYPVIEPMDGWIPAVGRVLYSASKPDAMIHIGYVHPYGIEQLPIYAERGEKWNTPVSSVPFDRAIKVYVEVK